jgi:hypothetical protein
MKEQKYTYTVLQRDSIVRTFLDLSALEVFLYPNAGLSLTSPLGRKAAIFVRYALKRAC